MSRGPVIDRLTMMPMMIKLQREGDKIVALMPAHALPTGLIAEGPDDESAIYELRKKMIRYFGGPTIGPAMRADSAEYIEDLE